MSSLDSVRTYNTFSTHNANFYIAGKADVITHVGFAPQHYPFAWLKDDSAFKPEIVKLKAFFNGETQTVDIPYVLDGTAFQKKVWQTISTIPYGETRSYKEVAIMAGSPNAQRAVGNVCNKNRLLLVVPCHRVVASNGLGGYGGNLDAKIWLLDIEQKHKGA